MTYKPLFDKVLIKPVSSEQSFGGLIIPDTANNLKKGIVVGAGPGKKDAPMSVKEGQTVFYQGGGTPWNFEGENYLLFFERDILLAN